LSEIGHQKSPSDGLQTQRSVSQRPARSRRGTGGALGVRELRVFSVTAG
jgi:hypothetical protein